MGDMQVFDNNIDYSYLILKNTEKVHSFIKRHGVFVTDVSLFWKLNKHKFQKFPYEK